MIPIFLLLNSPMASPYLTYTMFRPHWISGSTQTSLGLCTYSSSILPRLPFLDGPAGSYLSCIPQRPVQISLPLFPPLASSTPPPWLLVPYTLCCNCPFSYLLSTLEAWVMASSFFFRRPRIHFRATSNFYSHACPGLLSLHGFFLTLVP